MSPICKDRNYVFSTSDIATIKQKDKKDVVLLTTMYTLDLAEMKKMNIYTEQQISKPSVVIHYNKNMDEVNDGNQMLNKFHTMREDVKEPIKNICLLYRHDVILLLYKQLYNFQNQ